MAVQYNNRLRGELSCPLKIQVLDIPLGGGVVTNDNCIKAK